MDEKPAGRSIRRATATFVFLAAVAGATPAADDPAAKSVALAKASGEAWDCTLALLLAKEAVAASPTPEAMTALYSALAAQCETAALRHPKAVNSVAFSPDGAHVATACEDGSARVWSVAGAEEGATKCERPVVRAWFLGGADRVLVATRGAAADTVDLALWTRDGAGATTPLAAGAKTSDVLVTPSGDCVAAIASDGQASMWDRDGKLVKTLPAASIEFHPQGGALLVRSADGKAQVVTTKGGAKDLALGRPAARATFAPSGTALVWGDDGRVVGFAADGHKLYDVKHASSVEGAFGNAQGNRLLIAGKDGYGLYDVPSGKSVRQWPKRGAFTCGAFSASSDFVVTIDGGRHCSVWLQDDKLYCECDLAGEASAMSMSRAANDVLVRCADGTHLLFDVGLHPIKIGPAPVAVWGPGGEWLLDGDAKGQAGMTHMLGRKAVNLLAHSGAVVDAAFSPQGDRAATASKDGTARIWSLTQEGTETIGGFRGPCWYASLSWKEDRIVSVAWKTMRITDGRGKPVAVIDMPDSIVTCCATDDRVAIRAADADAAQLYGLDGKLIGTMSRGSALAGLTSSRNGKKFAIWGADGGEVRFFDAKAKAAGAIDVGDRILCVSFDDEGKRVVASCASGKVRIIPASGGAKSVAEFAPAAPAVWVSFVGKGDLAITVGKDADAAQLWTTKGKLVATLKGAAAPLTNYAWTEAGDAFVLTSLDKTARVFDAAGKQLAVLTHPDEVRQALFLPGDQRIVTACKDGSSRIWTRDGTLVAEIKAHLGACSANGFDAAAAQIVTAGADYCARIWPATVEGLLAVATKRCCRAFTDDERMRYRALLR